MSANPNQDKASKIEDLKYLWDVYKYRHELCWSAIYKITVAVIALAALPYAAKPGLTGALGGWMLVPPVIGTAFAAYGIFVINNELHLFSKAKLAYHSLQNRFLEAVLSEEVEEVKAGAKHKVTTSNARWMPFDIYAHVLVSVLLLLSLGNTVLLMVCWCRHCGIWSVHLE
jgi:hypothetical protein